jgi:phosphoribosylamine--glycine ligase
MGFRTFARARGGSNGARDGPRRARPTTAMGSARCAVLGRARATTRATMTTTTTARTRAGRGTRATRTARTTRVVRFVATRATRDGVARASSAKTNVLVVGGGGREHALCWRLASSASAGTLYCASGNAGIARERGVETVTLNESDHAAVVGFCRERSIGLVVVGPEAPLVDGLADALAAAGVPVFGPSKSAARLEGSKAFMKDLCAKYKIPTAEYAKFTDAAKAKAYIESKGAPIVVKTDGLAAGKGVIVAMEIEDALNAVDDMLSGAMFGSAGEEIVVEEFLDGEEASFFAVVGGGKAVALASAQDHKRVGDGDTGLNTGGMGAYSPAPVVTPEITDVVMRDIIKPTVDGMAAEGCPFTGVIFAGLMISKDGTVKLLEHNIRFGDPECQVLMARLTSDLTALLLAAATGTLENAEVTWSDDSAVVVVMAAEGYPGSYAKGEKITNLDAAGAIDGVKVLHAGTASDADGDVVSSGGRVLGVTAYGSSITEAAERAYEAVDVIEWPGGFTRRDIGWRAIAREKAR